MEREAASCKENGDDKSYQGSVTAKVVSEVFFYVSIYLEQ